MDKKNYYTQVEYFQKLGANYFPTYPWNQYSDFPFYANDKEFEIFVGTNTLSFDTEFMAIAFIDLEFEDQRKIFQFQLPKGISQVILKSIEINFRKFSPYKRVYILINILEEIEAIRWDDIVEETRKGYVASIFIKQILKNITNSKNSAIFFGTFFDKIEELNAVYEELDALNLDTDVLETLFDIESFLNKISVVDGNEANLITLKEILYMIGQTLDKQNFLSFFSEYKSNFLLSEKEINQDYIFNNLMEYFWTAPAYRQKTLLNRVEIPIETFEIKSQIKNQIKNVEELKSILKNVPFTKFPENLRFKSNPNFKEMVVDVSQIYGVYGQDSWELDGLNVHMNTIFKFSRLFEYIGIKYSKGNPIKLISYKDTETGVEKYWVYYNGKYRISALLALGINKIPVLVGEGEVV